MCQFYTYFINYAFWDWFHHILTYCGENKKGMSHFAHFCTFNAILKGLHLLRLAPATVIIVKTIKHVFINWNKAEIIQLLHDNLLKKKICQLPEVSLLKILTGNK